jgi:hypothetical protein
MKVKASFLVIAGSAVLVLVSALAHTGIHSALRADSLARYEAVTSYCEKADPDWAPRYVSKLASLTHGLSGDRLEAYRNSAGFRKAFAQANDWLSKASYAMALNSCTDFLAEK